MLTGSNSDNQNDIRETLLQFENARSKYNAELHLLKKKYEYELRDSLTKLESLLTED